MDLYLSEHVARERIEVVVQPQERRCSSCSSARTRNASHKMMPWWFSDCTGYPSVKTGTALNCPCASEPSRTFSASPTFTWCPASKCIGTSRSVRIPHRVVLRCIQYAGMPNSNAGHYASSVGGSYLHRRQAQDHARRQPLAIGPCGTRKGRQNGGSTSEDSVHPPRCDPDKNGH